jgi:hypothetical protein
MLACAVALKLWYNMPYMLVPRHRDYDMIQITPMGPNLAYQNHFDGALVSF